MLFLYIAITLLDQPRFILLEGQIKARIVRYILYIKS